MRAVSVEDLRPGMVLARTLVNKDMIVVLSENTPLTKVHIMRLRYLNIPVVYIKDEADLRAARSDTAVLSRSNAFVAGYTSVVNVAKSIFAVTAKSGKVPLEKTEGVVRETLAPLAKASGAIDHLYDLNHMASDVYNHSLRVSILAGVIAKWMRFSAKIVRDIILAGFMHDIGKTKFDQRLLSKNVSNLKGEDYETYIAHTVDGSHILNSVEGISDGVKMAAMQHHERMDGSGFPFGSSGPDINEYARIIAVADIYDNITTEREGYLKQTPFAAIAYITENMYTKLDPEVCVPMLTHIKDAFLGSRVVLSDGRKGQISAYPNDFAAHPMVSVGHELINLNKHPEIDIVEYNPKQ